MGRRLPPSAREALETLERARAVLAEAGVDPGEIDWLLELLENRGEIYFVGDELRITEP